VAFEFVLSIILNSVTNLMLNGGQANGRISMSDWMETNRGVVLPQHCDHYGHMNVRYYGHFFDEGGYHMWIRWGIKQSDIWDQGVGVVVANRSTDFLKEMKAGTLTLIKGGLTKIGNRSMAYEQRLFDAELSTLCARQTTVEVFFDTDTRTSAPMPDSIRKTLGLHLLPPEKLEMLK
jgi:acyl-CoA thioester hydrolase|tara:strand:- start:637 stop:1167 length:531 start_codon:yes stop_codon:yes gene_type:complete